MARRSGPDGAPSLHPRRLGGDPGRAGSLCGPLAAAAGRRPCRLPPHPPPGGVRRPARSTRMTLDSPGPRSRRWGVVLAVAVVAGAIGWLTFSGIGNALVYYRTPTELIALGEQGMGRAIRLGGLVQTGSLACADGGVDFIVTDGDTQ